MKTKTKKIKIYYLPVVICFLIAITQLVLSSSFTLTRWEGGGFGMYSEPDTYNSRIIWITIKNSNAEFRIRLHPLDNDLSRFIKGLDNEKKEHWENLIEESARIRNFPKLRANNKFLTEIAKMLLSVNEKTENRMRKNNRKIEVSLDIFQLNLDVNKKSLKSKKLFSTKADI